MEDIIGTLKPESHDKAYYTLTYISILNCIHNP